MMRVIRNVTVCMIFFILAPGLFASQFEVSDLKVSGMQWGPQKITAVLTSHELDYKFIHAEAKVIFSGQSQETSRHSKANFIIGPDTTFPLDIPIRIPGGFGKGVVQVAIYDVVDTLDNTLPRQLIFSTDIPLNMEVPAPVANLVHTGIQIPLFVEQSEVFDNLFNRLILLQLQRGQNIKDIAAAFNTDPGFVKQTVTDLIGLNYIKQENNVFKPNVAVIDTDKAAALKELASPAINNLYDIIMANLPAFDDEIKEMVQQGKMTGDPNDLFDGASVLYHQHPVITAISLWDRIGKSFLNNGAPFSGYRRLGLCDVEIGDFMYLVVGDSTYSTKTFYFYDNDPQGKKFVSGVVDSYVTCSPQLKAGGRYPINSMFAQDRQPLYYTYNDVKCNEALTVLEQGIPAYIETLRTSFNNIWGGNANDPAAKSARYWFWSYVAEKLIDKFEKDGKIKPEANLYIFQIVDY
ncbi:MAG: hypothetical protein CVT49_11515 [candidate division Zixibacteria bacterium HGW-Zixibacteria-1]|nr:MAG: hypothetical protein CVT49_11515 [candidate division Zixibacteria bacterium HGW-Zixibacteria-1]